MRSVVFAVTLGRRSRPGAGRRKVHGRSRRCLCQAGRRAQNAHDHDPSRRRGHRRRAPSHSSAPTACMPSPTRPHEQAGHIETISIGKWAWGNDSDGSWTEHKPNVARHDRNGRRRRWRRRQPSAPTSPASARSELSKARITPAIAPIPAKATTASSSQQRSTSMPPSGLPAYNIVAPTAGGDPIASKPAYSYGDDISVEAPTASHCRQEEAAAPKLPLLLPHRIKPRKNSAGPITNRLAAGLVESPSWHQTQSTE